MQNIRGGKGAEAQCAGTPPRALRFPGQEVSADVAFPPSPPPLDSRTAPV